MNSFDFSAFALHYNEDDGNEFVLLYFSYVCSFSVDTFVKGDYSFVNYALTVYTYD